MSITELLLRGCYLIHLHLQVSVDILFDRHKRECSESKFRTIALNAIALLSVTIPVEVTAAQILITFWDSNVHLVFLCCEALITHHITPPA